MAQYIAIVAYGGGAVAHYGPFDDRDSAESYADGITKRLDNCARRVVELAPPSTGKFPGDPNFGDYNIPPGGNHP